jgi:hypothetical protein
MLNNLLKLFTRPNRKPVPRRAVVLQVEELMQRIAPAANTALWTNMNNNNRWSDAGNWFQRVMPDATHIAVFSGTSSNANVNFDNGFQATTIAGIQTTNAYSGILTLSSGHALTVQSLANDTTTGFQWTGSSISQATANDVLIISGGGTAANNFWSGGTINSSAVQSNLYINGGTTLQITSGAATLGDTIVIGEDGQGGSTLEFHNQTSMLNVANNSAIVVAPEPMFSNPNQILFDTDVTAPRNVSKELGTTSADSFIDNYGLITRSNAGTLEIGLPIKNEISPTTWSELDLQSNLYISGASQNKTQNYSLDQEGGYTILENGSTLQGSGTAGLGVLINGGPSDPRRLLLLRI